MQRSVLDVEMRTAVAIAKTMHAGIYFDLPAAQRLVTDYKTEVAHLDAAFAEIFPPRLVRGGSDENYGIKPPSKDKGCYSKIDFEPVNPGSTQDMLRRLKPLGFLVTKYTDKGNAQLDDDSLRASPLEEAQLLASWRLLSKRIGMIEKYIENVDPDDGRIYHTINTLGASTGRMTHSNPNLAQTPREAAIRALMCATPGWIMVAVDADAIEARLLAHVLYPFDGGALTGILENGSKSAGTDFHSRNQRAAGLFSRDFAKTVLYSLLYGAGYEKIGTTVAEDAIKAGKPFTEMLETAGKRVKTKLMNNITGFTDLLDALIVAWKRDGFIVGIDGRRLYPSAEYTILNTLLQAAGAFSMKLALVLYDEWVESSGIEVRYLLNVHDEVVVETRPEHAALVKDKLVWAIEESGRELGLNCPLRANGKIGVNWSECK